MRTDVGEGILIHAPPAFERKEAEKLALDPDEFPADMILVRSKSSIASANRRAIGPRAATGIGALEILEFEINRLGSRASWLDSRLQEAVKRGAIREAVGFIAWR